MAEVLKVEKREGRGKRFSRRLRRDGKIPAVLYGHGEGTVSLALQADEVAAAIRHGSKLLELKGMVNENAVVREFQWDPFGVDILHVDLMRVQADERLEVSVPIEIRGEAPGSREGGVIKMAGHEVQIETLAIAIPDKLHLNVNSLEVNGALTAGDIEDLPAGAKLLTDATTVLVQCLPPVEELEEQEVAGESAEPEVIGRKAEEGEGEKSE